jgi:sulfur relay (sulfurtransferase) DsrC/TusE family protein
MEEDMKCLEASDFLKDWSQWEKTINNAIKTARRLGMSDEQIIQSSYKVGEFMTKRVCPTSKEGELIRDLWNAADVDERKVLAKLLFKMMVKVPVRE